MVDKLAAVGAGMASLADDAWDSIRVAVRRLMRPGLALMLVLLLVGTDAIPADQYFAYQLGTFVTDYQFNLTAWEIRALADKGKLALSRGASSLSAAEQVAWVRAFFGRQQEVDSLEGKLRRIYSGARPLTGGDAETLQAKLDTLLRQQARDQGMVEAILQNQVAEILAQEQFGIGPLVWPPVFCRLAYPPTYLVVSPQDRISRKAGAQLLPRLAISQREQLEDSIDESFAVSSLVEDLGGLGAFPSIILLSPSIAYTVDTIAHEWTHHYLVFTPLGWRYGRGGDLTTMNETVASVMGAEIGYRVMLRYYPDLAPPPPGLPAETLPQQEEEFDFGRVMRETRLKVDQLLAEGRIEEAENYMELQRQLLVSHGYSLRKLNQAYFAFHGAYAAGATTVDPIGPQIWQLRSASPSLKAFLSQVSRMRSYADLQRAAREFGTQ